MSEIPEAGRDRPKPVERTGCGTAVGCGDESGRPRFFRRIVSDGPPLGFRPCPLCPAGFRTVCRNGLSLPRVSLRGVFRRLRGNAADVFGLALRCRNVRKRVGEGPQRKARNRTVRTIREYDSLSRSRFPRHIPCRFLMCGCTESVDAPRFAYRFVPARFQERAVVASGDRLRIGGGRERAVTKAKCVFPETERRQIETGMPASRPIRSRIFPVLSQDLVFGECVRRFIVPFPSVGLVTVRGRKYVAAWALTLMPLFPGDAFSCGMTAVLLPGRRLQAYVYVFFMLGCTPPSSRTLRRGGFSPCTVRKAGAPNPCRHSPAS